MNKLDVPTMKKKIVIIGNGAAGNAAAEAAKRTQPDVDITIISEEKSWFYSPCLFHNYICNEVSMDRLFLRAKADYEKNGIRLILGEKVREIDTKKKTVFITKNKLRYDALILATGSKVAVPPIDGVYKQGVLSLKTLEDAIKVKEQIHKSKKVVVVGVGPIGINVSISSRKMGKETTIIARAHQILRRLFDQRPAALLQDELKKHGIQVLVNEKIEEILGKDKVEGVKTNRREIFCDTVILTTGMKPRVELAESSGLEIGKMGGILVDDNMRTSEEDVFACGDCIESQNAVTLNKEISMLWHNAVLEGQIAGINSVGGTRRYVGSLNLMNINVFEKSASALGLTTDNPEEVIELYEEKANEYLKISLKNGKIIGAQIINKIQLMPLILNLALKKISVEEFLKILEKRRFLTVSPEYIRLEQFFKR